MTLGDNMDVTNNLIELRILLNSICDGFSVDDLSKDMSLSTKTKILFLLQERDLGPCEMIKNLCIAKSNLANILKSMIKENLIESYKNLNNSKNIFYRITDSGQKELKDYKDKLYVNIHKKFGNCETELTEKVNEIIHFIKGKEND